MDLSAAEVAEILYRMRCIESVRTGREWREMGPIVKDHCRYTAGVLASSLRHEGHDPGSTAEDADRLKLRLIRGGADPDVPSGKEGEHA